MAGWLGVATPAFAAKPLQIMLLGDTFTSGEDGDPSYRFGLWKRLIDAELEFDFVGTRRSDFTQPLSETHNASPQQPFDGDHQAYPDWRIDHFLNGRHDVKGNLSTWLDMYTPDVAVVFLGTHDVLQNHPTEWAERAMRRMVIALRRDNERVAILLVVPPAVPGGNTQLHLEMANAFTDLAGRETTGQSPIRAVDLYHGFHADEWLSDKGTTLTEEGAQAVAERIGAAVLMLDEAHLKPSRRTSAQAWGSVLVVPLGAAVGFFLLARTQLRREREAVSYHLYRRDGGSALSASSPVSSKPSEK